jgi:hypothetical protein
MTSIAYGLEKDYSVIKKQIKFFTIISLGTVFGVTLARILRNPYRKSILKISHSLETIIKRSQQKLVFVENLDVVSAKAELDRFSDVIREFRMLKADLEKYNYLNSTALKVRTMKSLSSLYNVQIVLKQKAFNNQTKTPTDTHLITALSSNSQQVISNKLISKG